MDHASHDADRMCFEHIHDHVAEKCLQVIVAYEYRRWVLDNIAVCLPLHERLSRWKLLE